MNPFTMGLGPGLGRSPSLRTFNEYRDEEAASVQRRSSVSREGLMLEYETLELRVHPPNVVIDNDAHETCTVITIDSANRPGTLVEVGRPPLAPFRHPPNYSQALKEALDFLACGY
jgi:hypothetical protein